MGTEEQAEVRINAGEDGHTNDRKIPVVIQLIYFEVQYQNW